MTEDQLTDLLRDGIETQLESNGSYIRFVQDRKGAVIDGGLFFRELAEYILAKSQT